MCKTHCLDTDSSDAESTSKLATPPIRISFRSPDGPSVMEIEPRKYKKSSHKRKHSSKHKNKKHSKKAKYSDSERVNTSDTALPDPVATHPIAEEANGITYESNAEDSECHDGLIIDIPGERHGSSTKKSNSSSTKPTTSGHSRDKDKVINCPGEVGEHPGNHSHQQTVTKTKARLRKQKITAKSDRNRPNAETAAAGGVVAERSTRSLSTYTGADGRHVSVGDIIWGKIVGFPWWPGRVCAITVSETVHGLLMDYVADIDWYCSPTKSHLPCSAVYPFLDDFGKR